MRLAFAAIASCGCVQDFGVHGETVWSEPLCESVENLALCNRPLAHDRAQKFCAGLGGSTLVHPYTLADRDHVVAIGAAAWPEDPRWWAGWPIGYDCPLMGLDETVQGDCDEPHPFVCEFVDGT